MTKDKAIDFAKSEAARRGTIHVIFKIDDWYEVYPLALPDMDVEGIICLVTRKGNVWVKEQTNV